MDEESASDVTLTLDGVETTTTDDDGRYVFDRVPAGMHDLSVTPPEGTECTPESQTVDVPAGGEVTADFTCTSLAATGDLVVTVTGDGDPLEGASVSITGPDSGTGTTGADGTVTFTGLEPGDYTVEATADGFSCNPTTASVAAGETATAEVTCAALAATGDLVVTVTGDGDPLEGATVSITGPDSRTGTTGSDGTVTFTGLEPGDYTVDATADGFTCGSTTASVAAGETATAEVSCTST